MIFILPFLFLLLALVISRNNVFSLCCGIFVNGLVYLNSFPAVTSKEFVWSILPRFCVQIFSPEEYLYPVLFFVIVGGVIELLRELRVFDSYAILVNVFFHKFPRKIFDLTVILSSVLFFLDDYLGLFGIKSFFSPLLKNTEEQRLELAQYSVLVDSSPVLFFFSTWSVVIIKQIELIKNNLFGSLDYTGMYYFCAAKKYFFYPILLYVGFLMRLLLKKNSTFVLNTTSEKKSTRIYLIDIALFFVLPFCICGSFFYHLYVLGHSFAFLDVSLVMFHGAVAAFVITLLLVRYFKSVSFSFLIQFLCTVFYDMIPGVVKLSLCWLFSKITFAILSTFPLLSLPSAYAAGYPVAYFLISLCVSLVLGSEWGAISIMVPLLLFAKEFSFNFLLILLGAIISGIIAGAHLSPVSNTMMMQSAVFDIVSLRLYFKRIYFIVVVSIFSCLSYAILGIISSF